MAEITKQDLMDFKTDIKDHIDTKLEPITQDINGHQNTLYGKEGRDGLVRDVNNIKNSGRIFKWIAGTGFGGMALSWMEKLIR